MFQMIGRCTIAMLAGLLLSGSGAAESKSKEFVIVTAPNDEFHLALRPGSHAIWFVPTRDPSAAAALPWVKVEMIDHDQIINVAYDTLEATPRCFVSPDSRWIFAQIYTQEDSPTGVLYRKADKSSAPPGFEPAIATGFEKLAWQFFCKEWKVSEDVIGLPTSYGIRYKSITFGGWSPDSARLLVALSGTVGKPKEPEGGGSAQYEYNASRWLCYFNTRSGEFELTERLRKANSTRPNSRPANENAAEPNAVLAAEAIGQESPEIPAQDRFKKADGELNNIYQALLKSLPLNQKTQLQDEQRAWLGERDLFAAVHANQSWSPFPNASRIEGAAITTESRLAELEKRLGSVKKP